MAETRTTVRLPPEMHDRIRALADRERRSVHAQLLVLLERGLDVEETTDPKEGSHGR